MAPLRELFDCPSYNLCIKINEKVSDDYEDEYCTNAATDTGHKVTKPTGKQIKKRNKYPGQNMTERDRAVLAAISCRIHRG
jgi:hypothetical protein